MSTDLEILELAAQTLDAKTYPYLARVVRHALTEIEIFRERYVGVNVGSQAAIDVFAERQRQVVAEGFSLERDDTYGLGELGLAAALYALPYDARVAGEPLIAQDDHIRLDMALEIACGWQIKPEPVLRRRYVKAGALIIAEIERRDRLAASAATRVGSAEGNEPTPA